MTDDSDDGSGADADDGEEIEDNAETEKRRRRGTRTSPRTNMKQDKIRKRTYQPHFATMKKKQQMKMDSTSHLRNYEDETGKEDRNKEDGNKTR